ncbi:hypothetical protein SNEBB_006504 [Seison nebaliae]|nr:hypothetical protein SNEBB_006504 [Seison nebaliae]
MVRKSLTKQQNKVHKTGKHRSKGTLIKNSGGKVVIRKLKDLRKELNVGVKVKSGLSKIDRKNRSKQIVRNQIDINRFGSIHSIPLMIGVIHPNGNEENFLRLIDLFQQAELKDDVEVKKISDNNFYLKLKKLKKHFNFISISSNDSTRLDLMNDLYLYDGLVMLWEDLIESKRMEIGDEYENLLKKESEYLFNQFFKTSLPKEIISILLPNPSDSQLIDEIKQFFKRKCVKSNLYPMNNSNDFSILLFKLSKLTFSSQSSFMKNRHGIIIDNIDWNHNELLLSGYVKGNRNMNINCVYHNSIIGDVQLESVEMMNDEMNEIIHPTDRHDIVCLNIPSMWDQGEQTWPTKEELEAVEHQTEKKKVRNGMSEYQAAWIIDDDDDDDDDENEEDENEKLIGDEKMEIETNDDKEESNDVNMKNRNLSESIPDEMDEIEVIEEIRKRKDYLSFPDEIDTPLNIPARLRFQKFRGLESLRTSPWDPKENLPEDYSSIFQFKNFNHSRKVAMNEETQIDNGTFIRLHISDESKQLFDDLMKNYGVNGSESSLERPFTLFPLFRHETKLSLHNIRLFRNDFYDGIIKSKEKLIFSIGSRTFEVAPIYSEDSDGKKHRMLKTFEKNTSVIATFYAPISFSTSAVYVHKRLTSGQIIPVADGQLLSIDPDRIILKRYILSGHPYKIQKHGAVIRFMFFTRDDVLWFKPIKLRTKWGRHGYIKEPLGTHGYMKCEFDGQLKSQDTILLNLYKRVFPKMSYVERRGLL